MTNFWRVTSADDEDGDTASSISDVFTTMLNVNEDIITATAECQADGDISGLIAYQCILHRDLMEMAEFIDSIFGVYSSIHTINNSTSDTTSSTLLQQKKSDESEHHLIDLTAEVAEDKAFAPTAETFPTVGKKKLVRQNTQRGALLAAIEAGEKVRETRRSKEQWIKSRHQVLEEEGVSAITNKNSSGMLEIASTQLGEKETQQENGGLALANQLRAHQHVAAFLQTFNETTPAGPPPTMNVLLANQLAMHATAPPLAVPAPLLPSMSVATIAAATKPIKPSTAGDSTPKIALPPAHSMYDMLFSLSGIFNPQATAGFMPLLPWQQQARTAMPARTSVKTPYLKRMCESCRKRHFSVRQCRLVLQHSDPEWQPAQPPPANRRRRRKQSASNTTKQVT
ncbi:unnamed protein product [Peronospora farinosa]|uniref:Uncharacterized protein n=1 Tax=Peronospora farinosa TaxID=134698 RepID=A0AAV0TBU0_9STRA|nr:unnamed protein product [Peronospora farinosa]CAI5717238.1 unnamed protein product [Peronospora farinosa]